MNGDPEKLMPEPPLGDEQTASAGGAGMATAAPLAQPPADDAMPLPVPLPVAPAPPPPVVIAPRPRPPIVPERMEDGFRTERVLIDFAEDEQGWYVTIVPNDRHPHIIYCAQSAMNHLVHLATSGSDPGRLWNALCDIPLERPLPSRHLEEELRALLTAFGNEVRR
jgi:hypothetical protein